MTGLTPRGWGAAGVWVLVLLLCLGMLTLMCLGAVELVRLAGLS